VSPPEEVTVHGTKPKTRYLRTDDLRAEEVRSVPGTFGDPFQAIGAMPGVAATASGLPYFYVRGAPPADIGYFVDGVPLPTLFHIGPGPSVVAPASLDHISFFPGTAPARFGRFAGGIITGELARPSPVARGEAEIRLFDASAFAESPLDDASTAFVAGRYGYPNLLLSVFAPRLSLKYWDYSARVTRALCSADTLSLFVIGSYDDERDASQELIPISSQFHRIDLRYDHRWADGSVRLASTLGFDETSHQLSTDESEVVTATSGRLRLELEQELGAGSSVSAGADANAARYLYEFTGSQQETSPIDAEQIAGAYADFTLRPAEGLVLVPGARVDGYRTAGHLTFSFNPKLRARIGIAQDVTWVSAFGVAQQEPTYIVPVPGLRIDPSGGLQTTYQLAEGIETPLPWAMLGTLTAFYNAHRNMSDYVSDCGTLAQTCSIVQRVDGRSYGVEVFLQRAFTQRLGGWLSYTLSRAERRIGNVPYLSPFDRTHVLSLVMRYDFGKGIGVGVRGTYYSGRPDIPNFAFPGQSTTFAFGPGLLSQHRLPEFYRIDLRAEKRWNIGTHEWLAAILEFFDATLTKEAIDFQCNFVAGVCTAREIGPIALPSIGLAGGF
jgi:hypothetical protein